VVIIIITHIHGTEADERRDRERKGGEKERDELL